MRTALLTPARLAKMLASVAAILIVLNVAFTLYTNRLGRNSLPEFAAALDYQTQWNIASIFLSLVLLLCAGIATFIGTEDVGGRLRVRFGWLALSLIMAYLCLDGLFSIHQMIVPILAAKMRSLGINLGWLGPHELIAATLTVLYMAFLCHLPRKSALLMLLGSALFIVGAIGLGAFVPDGNNLVYRLMGNLEQVLQLAGVVIIATTMLAILEEVDQANAIRAAAARHVHPRVAIGS